MSRCSARRQLLGSAAGAALLAASTAAWSQAPSFVEPRTQTLHAAPGQVLAIAATGNHGAAVAAFMRQRGLSEATVQSLVEIGGGAGAAGVTHVRFEQQVDGLRVYGSSVKAAFNARGELFNLIERIAPVPDAAPREATISARDALDAAMARVHPGVQAAFTAGATIGASQRFAGGAFFHRDPEVTRVLVPQADGSLAHGYLVETWTQQGNLLDVTLVGGDGAALAVERRTANDRYNVFAIDPVKSSQAVASGPGTGNAESPIGWLGAGKQTTININGNNVSAYLDAKSDDRPDRGGDPVTTGDFLTVFNLTQQPTASGNTAVAVQNLFYLNNVIHDILYRHGFNETAGNFQINNFGVSGAGNDPVNAEAQDGGGLDNANFATPADGSRPRMQMYLWAGLGATHEVAIGNGPTYDAMGAEFGTKLNTSGVTAGIVLGDDGVLVGSDGCEPLPSTVRGKIVLLDRGTCTFVVKVENAAGVRAAGVIVANNVDDAIVTMSGLSRVRIPAVMISRTDGADLRARINAASLTGTMRGKAVQPLQKDGDLDSDLVYHEYGHGLTWRMIGGMSGPLAGAIGEGASDVVAFMVNGDDVIGEYSISDAAGVRRFPYKNYPTTNTYGTIGPVIGLEVHKDGEIYAAAMWRLRELWLGSGLGLTNEALFTHFVDGMNYTPPTPAFEHMRNGMLDSIAATHAGDTNAANTRCALVWQAFAQYGIGEGATGVDQGSSVRITESSVTRSDCIH